MRPHPDKWPVNIPSRQLRSATEEQLAERYSAHQGESRADSRIREQVLYELGRRDRVQERAEGREERRRARYSRSKEDRRLVVENEFVRAEAATNGYMVNARGREAGVEPRTLFTGPESRARKYASEELLEYWEHNPRPTQAMFEGGDTRIGYTGQSIASLGPRRRRTSEEEAWRDRFERDAVA